MSFVLETSRIDTDVPVEHLSRSTMMFQSEGRKRKSVSMYTDDAPVGFYIWNLGFRFRSLLYVAQLSIAII